MFSSCQAFICHQIDKIEKYLRQQGNSHPDKAVKFFLKFKKAKTSKQLLKNTAFVIIASNTTKWMYSQSASMIRIPWEIRLQSHIRSVIWISTIVSFSLNFDSLLFSWYSERILDDLSYWERYYERFQVSERLCRPYSLQQGNWCVCSLNLEVEPAKFIQYQPQEALTPVIKAKL